MLVTGISPQESILRGCNYNQNNGALNISTHDAQTGRPVENLGLTDRALRFITGLAMLVFGYFAIENVEYLFLGAVIILLSEYPLMTSILGWDPLYPVTGSRSCSIEKRRELYGPLSLEVDVALYCKLAPDYFYDE